MRYCIPAVAATVLAGILAGCSSSPPPEKPQPGSLVAGTAQVTVNGVDTGTTHAVQCVPAGFINTITIGDQQSGVTALVSSERDLVADSVTIRNLAGFSGSYNAGLGDTAKVTMTGRTYHVTGTADGFRTDKPSFRTSGTFAINASC